jgi:hypothetical protein
MLDPPPWKDSLAKAKLQADILSGAVPAQMTPEDLYRTSLEFQPYPSSK